MHFTRTRDLVLAGIVGLAAGFMLFEFGYESLPPIPTLAGVTLALLAVVECVLAFGIRKRIRAGRVALYGVGIARSVVLAKASSVLGSVMLGAWFGILGYLVPRADRLVAASEDVPSAIVGVACAVSLIAAALWLEYCCRDPHADEHERSQRGERSS